MNNPIVQIGATKETVKEARESIIKILDSHNDQLTKQKAIEALSTICAVNNVAFSNNNIVANNTTKKK